MLPKISIVTPTLNQAIYLERTIQSVLGQNYPNLEYIIVDGGSTDGTLDILQRYAGQLLFVSEKDAGQSDALNKGFRMASGEVLAYLNSDDEYEPNALLRVGEFFEHTPEAFWVTGRCRIIDSKGQEILQPVTLYKNLLLSTRSRTLLLIVNYISQPATFWRREVLERVGYFDQNLSAVMDYDYWLRISQLFPLFVMQSYLAKFRFHAASKTFKSAMEDWEEELVMLGRHTQSRVLLWLHRLHRKLITKGYRTFQKITP